MFGSGLLSQTFEFPGGPDSCERWLVSHEYPPPSAHVCCVRIPAFVVAESVPRVQSNGCFHKRERERETERWKERRRMRQKTERD